MKIKEITNKIEEEFPIQTAMEWDNVGLLLGDNDKDVSKVLLTLDVTEGVVEEAIAAGCELILSHHPILFSPVNKITSETEEGRIILNAAKKGIAIYAAHTNCDVGKNGINAHLAELFELQYTEILEENGLGRIGNLKNEMVFSDFAKLVCKKLDTPRVRAGGDQNRLIKRIAIGSGACADSIPRAVEMGADVMLTADMKYHEMLSAEAMGINVVDAGHYPTEIVVMDIFEKILKEMGIELIKSHNADVFKYI